MIIAYIDRSTGAYPLDLADVRFRSGVGFGETPDRDVLDRADVDPVEGVPPPAYDATSQVLSEGPPERTGETWRQAWVLTERPASSLPAIKVSAVQAKTALYDAGLYNDVEAALGAHPYALIRIWWASAQEWSRDHPYVAGMAATLGIDDARVDALFDAARAVAT